MPKSPQFRTAVALVLGLASILALINLGRGLYVDEYTTWSVLGLSPSALIENRFRAGHLPGYFLALSWWSHLAGVSEVALRLPSVVLAVTALAATTAMVRDLFDRRIATLAGVILATHQLFLWTAQTARPYAPLLLCTVIGWWALVRWLRGGSAGWLVALFVSGLIGFATQPLHGATVAAQALLLIVAWNRNRSRASGALAVLVATAVLATPMLRALAGEQQNFREKQFGLPLSRLIDGVAQVYLGDYTFAIKNDLPKFLVLAVLVAHLVGARKFLAPREATPERPGVLLSAWILVPLAALLVMAGSGGKSVLAHERYYVTMLPAFAIVAALGADYWLGRLGKPWGNASLAALAVALLGISAGWLVQPGDGPSVLARRMGDVKAVAGEEFSMAYEFRDRKIQLVHIELSGPTPDLSAMAEAPDQVWLVVYDNHKHPLDVYFTAPPAGWSAVRREEYRDARAVLLQRDRPQSLR